MRNRSVLVQRPEFVARSQDKAFGVVQKPLTPWERVYGNSTVRKAALLAVLAAAWELYARKLDSPLLFPTFAATVEAFVHAIASALTPPRPSPSIPLLLAAYSP